MYRYIAEDQANGSAPVAAEKDPGEQGVQDEAPARASRKRQLREDPSLLMPYWIFYSIIAIYLF